jgi:hypothetical protein
MFNGRGTRYVTPNSIRCTKPSPFGVTFYVLTDVHIVLVFLRYTHTNIFVFQAKSYLDLSGIGSHCNIRYRVEWKEPMRKLCYLNFVIVDSSSVIRY